MEAVKWHNYNVDAADRVLIDPGQLRLLTVAIIALDYGHPGKVERQQELKCRYEDIVKGEVFEKVTDEYIECLIHHRMWNLGGSWKTAAELGSKHSSTRRIGVCAEGQHLGEVQGDGSGGLSCEMV